MHGHLNVKCSKYTTVFHYESFFSLFKVRILKKENLKDSWNLVICSEVSHKLKLSKEHNGV